MNHTSSRCYGGLWCDYDTTGVPTAMTWDDDCTLCSSDHCVDGNCAVDFNQCTNYGGSTNCDVKVYVAWAGTDVDGFYFTSQDRTLSSFRQWSITGAFNSATNFLPNALPTIDSGGAGTATNTDPRNYRSSSYQQPPNIIEVLNERLAADFKHMSLEVNADGASILAENW